MQATDFQSPTAQLITFCVFNTSALFFGSSPPNIIPPESKRATVRERLSVALERDLAIIPRNVLRLGSAERNGERRSSACHTLAVQRWVGGDLPVLEEQPDDNVGAACCFRTDNCSDL